MPSSEYASMDLSGQVVLVTGASSGIGEACALRFAEAGCKLIVTARRTERLNDLAQRLQSTYQAKVHVATLDVANMEQVEGFLASLPDDFSKVSILVNNAGLALGTSSVHEYSPEDAVTMINTNVTAVALLTRQFAPGMVQRNKGHIINISSIAAHYHYKGGSIYCGSKSFIEAFTNAARHDLVGTDVRVTAISPGAVQTEFSNVRYKGDASKADEVYDGIIPLNASDIADNVLYAATRPAHVQIGEIITYATYQSGPGNIARVLKDKTYSSLEQFTNQIKGKT